MSAGNVGVSMPPKGFLDAMAEHGLFPDSSRIVPGSFHRFPGSGKGKTSLSGWCKLFDDCTGGVFGDYAGADFKGFWQDRHGKKITQGEEAVYRAKVEKAYQESREATKRNNAKGAGNALKIWEAALPAPSDHSYIVEKGITRAADYARIYRGGLVIRDMACDGALIIPAIDATGKIATLQFIQGGGEKRLMVGCKKGGSFLMIGAFPAPCTVDQSGVVCIAEGFATGASLYHATKYPVAVAFDAGNLAEVAKFFRVRHPGARLVICGDNDHHEDGEPNTGLLMASKAAKAIGGLVAIPVLINGWKTDFNDMARQPDGKERIRAIIDAVLESATGTPGTGLAEDCHVVTDPPGKHEKAEVQPLTNETPEEAVQRLSALTLLEYDRVRQFEADCLGVRASTLDKEVSKARGNGKPEESGEAVVFDELEPWPDPVEGAALLDEMAAIFKRFVILPPHADTTLSLWCMFTYLSNHADVSPILNIMSPEKRCGKSTLREVVGCLVNLPLTASSITTSALFRCVSLWEPTLLIDETDTFITKENEYLRGIINSGHTRSGARIMLNVGDDHEPRWFKTWCPKVLCGIGHLPDTIKDRSILVELRRRVNSEPIEKLRYVNQGIFEDIKRKCVRFSLDIQYKLLRHRPNMPHLLHDRAADNWEPLFSIAHFAGGDWPARARSAALFLCGEEKEAVSVNVELLEDIKAVFDSMGVDKISTAVLIECLCENPEKPWGTWNRGMPISPYQLSQKLKDFFIFSGNLRMSDTIILKGYRLQQFQDAFTRYTQKTDKRAATTLQVNDGGGCSGFKSAT